MKELQSTLIVFLLLLLSAANAHSGAWIRPAGSVYARAAYSFLNSDSYYTRDGNSITTAEFSSASLDLYAEYGFGRGLDAVVTFPVFKRFAFETSEASTGIGDPGIELRQALLNGRTPLTIGVGVDLPIGDSDGSTPLKGGSGAAGGTIRLPTGDGETNVRAVLYASHSLDPVPAYLSAEAGYNLRTEGFTDEYLFALQAGYNPVDPLRLSLFLRGRGPVTTADRERSLEVSNGLGEGVQYTGLGGGLSLRVAPGLSVSADLFTSVGRVTNIYGGRNVVLGISLER